MKKRILTTAVALAFCTGFLGVMFLRERASVDADSTGAEWIRGNSTVTATMTYDITNSVYGEAGDNPGYWRIRAYDNSTLVSYNSALSAEDFWTKTSYLNLKPTFYETVANAENPGIEITVSCVSESVL